MAEIIYIANGKEYTESELAALAEQNGKDLEEFKMLLGAVVKQPKTTKSPITEEEVEDYGPYAYKRGSPSFLANFNAEDNDATQDIKELFEVNTSTSLLNDSFVTPNDLLGTETQVAQNIKSKLAVVGISTSEGTSFGSTDALNFSTEQHGGVDAVMNNIGDGVFKTMMDAISVSDDDDLVEQARLINEYIKNNGNSEYLNEANARSGELFKEYTNYIDRSLTFAGGDIGYYHQIKSPTADDGAYFNDLRNQFKDILKKEVGGGGYRYGLGMSNVPGKEDELNSGAPVDQYFNEGEEVTIDDFSSEKEFELYKIWRYGGDLGVADPEEVKKYNLRLDAEYAAKRSSEFSSDLEQYQREDLLALSYNIENQASSAIDRLPVDLSEFEKREKEYTNYAATYADNPTIENWEGLTVAFENILKSQEVLQETQNIVGTYNDVAPLAIQNFGADYDRLNQLRTGFKTQGVNMLYLGAQMGSLYDELWYNVTGSNAALLSLAKSKAGEQAVANLGEDIRRETATYQKSLKVDEITSLKDAGRWLASSTTQLLPSATMAMTGQMALPLFFMTGAGGAGLDIAIDQKNASIRLAKNFELINGENPPDAFQMMAIKQEMKEDQKTLDISLGQKLTKQGIDGLAEVMFEKYGTMLIMRGIKDGIKHLGKMSVKEAFYYSGKGFVGGINREGASEWGTNAVQNFASIYVLDQNKNFFPEDAVGFEKFKGSFSGGLEVYAQGGLMGGGLSSINGFRAVKQAITSEMYTKKDMAYLKESLAKLKELTGIDILTNPGVDLNNLPIPMRTPEVQKLIDEIQNEKYALDEKTLNRLGNDLTYDQVFEIGQLNYELRENNAEFQALASLKKVTPEQLRLLQTKHRNKFEELMNKRESILTNKDSQKTNIENNTLNQLGFNLTSGYQMYNARMVNASVFNINKRWNDSSQETKQSYYDQARKELNEENNSEVVISKEAVEKKGKQKYFKEIYTKSFESGLENAQKFTDTFITEEIAWTIAEGKDSNNQIILAYAEALENTNLSEKIKNTRKAELLKSLNDGSFDGVSIGNSIIISKDAAVEKMRTGVSAHEALHPYVKQQFKTQKNIDEKGQQLLDFLEKSQPDLFAQVKFRLDQSYTNKDKDGNFILDAAYYEEAMNALSDVLADDSGDFGANIKPETINVLRNFINGFLPSALQFKENQGFGVYQFVKDFNKAAHFGGKSRKTKGIPGAVMDPEEKEEARERSSLTKQAANAKTVVDNIGTFENYDPNSDALARQLPGMVDAVISGTFKGLRKEVQKELNSGTIFNLINPRSTGKSDLNSFTPAEYDNDGKKTKGNDSLYGYLNARIRQRMLDYLEDNPNLINDFNSQIDENTLKIEGDANSKKEIAVKSIYKSLLASRVVDTDVLKNINAKIIKTVRVLKNRIDKAVSKNTTQTPIVREIINSIGKDVDIDIKKEMGGKDKNMFKNYLVKNKKAILENMTTTYLSKAFPEAIQKKIDGKWTSDWQGKETEISDTSTNLAGMTSGFQLMRRLPNVNNQISAEQFLENYIGKNGDLVRGRKESLAKAIGGEVSFEIINRDLKTEGPIYQALVVNQQALGLAIAENSINELTRQMERGQIKFSVTSQDMTDGLYELLDVAANFNTNSNFFEESLAYQPKAIQDEWNNLGLTDMFSAGQTGFKTPLLDWADLPSMFKPYLGTYRQTITAKSQEVSMNQLKDFSEALMKEMPSDLVKFLGADVFGLTSRYLDPALTKRDKDGNIIPGEQGKYLDLANLRKEIIKNLNKLDLPFNPANIEIYNSSSGIMQQIGKVLDKPITKAKKIEEIERRFGDRIRGANGANKAALNYLMEKATEMLISKPELSPGFMRWMESNTSNAKGMRGLTSLDMFDIRDGSQAATESHPDYLDALQFARDSAKKSYDKLSAKRKKLVSLETYVNNRLENPTTGALSHLRHKGEHVDPAANVSFSLAKIVLTNAARGLKHESQIETILVNQAIEVNEAIANYSQTLGVKLYSDIQDAKLGSTSKASDFRVLSLSKDQLSNYTTLDGRTAEQYVKDKIYKLSDKINIDEQISVQAKQKALDNATLTKLSVTPKKIRVFDFDDTLATTKSNVLYTTKDGIKGSLTAEQFAAQADQLTLEGVKFDFSEFNEVMDGKKGPLFKVAELMRDKRGTEDMYILTARPQASAPAIYKFLNELGLNIPLKNITGLENGSPQAKADWIINKAAEGYNDFYFADDAESNVKAVRDVLETIDVKSKVQQARINFSKTFSTDFNEMLERNSGVAAEKRFSDVVARRRGTAIGKYKMFLPPSAEDFEGLTSYVFAGKGKQGTIDQKFFRDALIKPYMRGVSAIENSKQNILKDYKNLQALSKQKGLGKLIPSGDFTYDQAVRVFLWEKAGYEIPGISKRDKVKLNELVAADTELANFANGLLLMSKKDNWTEPGKYWDTQTLLSDLNNLSEKTNRTEFLQEFNDNVDVIFSKDNLNKVEALYGTNQREALEDLIYRMKNGTNRPSGGNKITNAWNNWVNNSVGAIMFFNRKSALLQTLSTVNFINWSDNNPVKAAAAFANQPQFWRDFAYIFNSNKLKERRSGLKLNVNESEIANAAKGAKNKASAILSYLLKIGFTPTQLADSFAISSGGATMYRNRINTYMKQGMSKLEAQEKAWEEFSEIADSTQQSSDPMLISQEQASVVGRLVLNFQNTTMQYTRLMKKAGLDILKRRISKGYENQFQSDVANVSKIIYYGAIQNFIFSALQNAIFAFLPGFDDDEEIDQEAIDKKLNTKTDRIISGMMDTLLKGSGLKGAVLSTIKNVIKKYIDQDKKGYMADHTYTILEAANISPPIGSKLRKIYSAIQTKKFEKAVIDERGFDIMIDGRFNLSPKYQVYGSLIEGVTNFPSDRIVSEVSSITEAFDGRNTKWQRLALSLGWRNWDVGAKNEENDLIKTEAKENKKKVSKEKSKIKSKDKKDKKKEEEKLKAKEFRDYYMSLTRAQKDSVIRARRN